MCVENQMLRCVQVPNPVKIEPVTGSSFGSAQSGQEHIESWVKSTLEVKGTCECGV